MLYSRLYKYSLCMADFKLQWLSICDGDNKTSTVYYLTHSITFHFLSLPFGKAHTDYSRQKLGHKAIFLQLDSSTALLKEIMNCDRWCTIITSIYVQHSSINPSACCRNTQKEKEHVSRKKNKADIVAITFFKFFTICSH